MITKPDKNVIRKRRHARVRKSLFGTQERPRLNVYRSNKHIYVQLIDDLNGSTVASASTKDNEINVESTSNVEAAKQVGEMIAKRAQDKGYKSVVFDRGGYLYHGRVKALADAAREAGLEF
ncbi:MAG: 50S ribosomal protein L18 [Bacillota bacterium]|uniref:Large ribosomal subunit protein uL18 n=1 Tax=Virgibacillus salarius TaxID=447199 RepID=A0A941DTW0_9BACI|nr:MULTISPECIES: 50S ribosomal protein L18 [Bacillaceae]NAZ08110.1 50S ribosomal protein L18 [Agaribacter marinus]MBR7795397.1 50S ribosomal protein L18 [Virgibacillus salarius]MCC2249779.1 50S ribosomal protein L18 [Virgibacillus sp. AGTR]MDY7044334.1 50S ribosomal protein L18 [Virgibacillus sp. M23]QRZ19166.1 50S ribosomal protein L18 [Virgibacillus sp. AGTR]